jgi:dipeptidase E
MRLLLVSNSGRPYLEHCRAEIGSFLGPIKRGLFVPFAAFIDPQAYVQKVRDALAPTGLELDLLDLAAKPLEQVAKAQALLVGGGNTYHLLDEIKKANLLQPIRERVLAGMPYIGWSAGSNIAGPTILTTNDWNVVGLSNFDALNFVPFNINPHYLEADPMMAQHSETRAERIAEYHKVNRNVVLGVEEQTSLLVEGKSVKVVGRNRVWRFERDKTPVTYRPGDKIEL